MSPVEAAIHAAATAATLVPKDRAIAPEKRTTAAAPRTVAVSRKIIAPASRPSQSQEAR